MKLASYEIVEQAPNDMLYAILTFDDGSTVGQYVKAGPQVQVDAEVAEHVVRIVASMAPKVDTVSLVGVQRTALEIATTLEVETISSAPAIA